MQEVKKIGEEISFGGITAKKYILFILLIIGCFHISFRNYLIFHAGIELFSIIIAFNIWIIALNSYETSVNSSFVFLGVAYGFIGFFDLLHTFAYDGMGVFSGNTANLATQLWIIARFTEAISLFIAFIYFSKHINFKKIFYAYLIIALLILISLFYWRIIPNCFIPGNGLTRLKIISEYIIIALLLATIFFLVKSRGQFTKRIYLFLFMSIVFTILSEISFTLYIDIQDALNKIGHLFKLVSFYMIYKAICETSLKLPYRLLKEYNKDLNRKAKEICRANEKLIRENSERMKLTDKLLRNEEVLRAVFDSSTLGILVAGVDGRVIHISREFIKMFKIPKDLIVAKKDLEIVEFISKQTNNPEEFKAIVIDSLKGKEKLDEIIYFKDDRVLRRVASPLKVNGEILGQVVIFVDMTDHKRAEKLQREVELQEKLLLKEREFGELKSQFFSNISHELKTPLNVILGTIQLVSLYFNSSIMDDNYKRMFKNIGIMRQNCYRLIRLVNNIVDINKISSGFYKLNLHNNNIISIIEDITLSVADYTKNRGVELIFDTDVEEKIIACDLDKIERIMLNLLSNAIKFTDPGGRIEVNISDKENVIQISVKDTGVGIPENMIESIFDRFYQVEGTIRRNKQGSGIGLSLVKSLVELHGGNIRAISQMSSGTEFVISLPVNLVKEEIFNYQEDKDNRLSHIERISIEFSDIYS